MTDPMWHEYGKAVASQVAAAVREILADAGVASEVEDLDAAGSTLAFVVRPAVRDAATVRVVLGEIDGRVVVGSATHYFEWLDIVTAKAAVADVLAGVVAGGYTEWGPPWRRRGRIVFPDGSRMHIGAGRFFDVWRRYKVRSFAPYASGEVA